MPIPEEGPYRTRVYPITSPYSDAVTILTSIKALNAVDITKYNFKAVWTSGNSIDKYFLEIAIDPDFSNLVQPYIPLTLNYSDIDTLFVYRENLPYYYRVRGYSTELGFTDYSNTIKVDTLNPPKSLPATDIQESQFMSHWLPLNNASSYELQLSKSHSFLENSTSLYENIAEDSLIIENLEPGTSYYYRVRAESDGSFSAYSNVILAITKSSSIAPIATIADTIMGERFIATWLGASNSNYELQLDDDIDFLSTIQAWNSISDTFYSVTVVNFGTYYYYRVRYVDEDNMPTSDFSNIISVLTLPNKPDILSPVIIRFGTLLASWRQETGASEYTLEISNDKNEQEACVIHCT